MENVQVLLRQIPYRKDGRSWTDNQSTVNGRIIELFYGEISPLLIFAKCYVAEDIYC